MKCMIFLSVAAAGALALGGCASNYAGEGALAGKPVRKGEVVEVAASDGQLVVVLKALALQNGALGDLVAVRNLDSRKEFTAFVTHENRVQVRF